MSQQTRSWWFTYRTSTGAFIQVTVQAPDAYTAVQMARAQYGSKNPDGSGLISENAGWVA